MKRRNLLWGAIPCMLLAFGCSKNNSATSGSGDKPVVHLTGNSVPSAYGTFQFSNVSSGKVLEVRGDATLLIAQSNPANVQQYTNFNTGTGSSLNQKWYLIQQGTGAITSSTAFKIMNAASGLYLEAPNGTSGTQLFQDHSNGFPSQAWYLKQVSGQSYYVIQNANGLVLTDHAGSAADGAAVTEETLANNTTQYWNLSSIANEAYRDDAVVQFFRRTHGSIAFDQGNSIALSYSPNNGKVLWIGEDTYTQNDSYSNGVFPCGQYFDVHNSALVQPASHSWDQSLTNNLVTHNSTYQYEILASPGAHDATETWPGVGVEINNHVYMYAYEGPQSAGYNDCVMYDFTEDSGGGLDWGTAVRHVVAGASDPSTVTYPFGWVKPGDGYVYAYGGVSFLGGNNVFVARFATGSPFTWTFWNGSSWASSPSTATAAQVATTATNVGVSYVNGKYVMVQMDFGYGCPSSSPNIYISTATSPTGPFTTRQQVYSVQDMINGARSNVYVINAHPEFVNGHNELLITYCINYTACSGVSTCTNGSLDPYYYELKAVRIPYSIPGL